MATRYSSLVLAVIATFIAPGMGSPACPARSSTKPGGQETLPASCTYRPQATWYATTGCDIACPTAPLCIADALVVLPCGCTRAAVSPTVTTLCPTASSNCQFQCSTGWGIGTTTDSNCPGSATATAAPTAP